MTVLPVDSINLAHYSTAELLKLRDRINVLLPSAELEDIDLSTELVRTFQTAQALLNDSDDDTPLTQKAATINAITSVLKTLADAQKTLYSAERQQRLERSLIGALQQFPELQDSFFKAYEQ